MPRPWVCPSSFILSVYPKKTAVFGVRCRAFSSEGPKRNMVHPATVRALLVLIGGCPVLLYVLFFPSFRRVVLLRVAVVGERTVRSNRVVVVLVNVYFKVRSRRYMFLVSQFFLLASQCCSYVAVTAAATNNNSLKRTRYTFFWLPSTVFWRIPDAYALRSTVEVQHFFPGEPLHLRSSILLIVCLPRK